MGISVAVLFFDLLHHDLRICQGIYGQANRRKSKAINHEVREIQKPERRSVPSERNRERHKEL